MVGASLRLERRIAISPEKTSRGSQAGLAGQSQGTACRAPATRDDPAAAWERQSPVRLRSSSVDRRPGECGRGVRSAGSRTTRSSPDAALMPAQAPDRFSAAVGTTIGSHQPLPGWSRSSTAPARMISTRASPASSCSICRQSDVQRGGLRARFQDDQTDTLHASQTFVKRSRSPKPLAGKARSHIVSIARVVGGHSREETSNRVRLARPFPIFRLVQIDMKRKESDATRASYAPKLSACNSLRRAMSGGSYGAPSSANSAQIAFSIHPPPSTRSS